MRIKRWKCRSYPWSGNNTVKVCILQKANLKVSANPVGIPTVFCEKAHANAKGQESPGYI